MLRNAKISEAVDEHLDWLRSRGTAEGTIKGYRSTLGAFARSANDILIRRVESRHVVLFINSMPWQPSTRNERVGKLKAFFAWCRNNRLMPRDHDPLYKWGRSPVPDAQHLRIPRSDWGRLLSACETPRERTVIATGLYLFLRASEQRMIQMKHVHLSKNEVDIYRVKGKKWDVMPIPLELQPFIREQAEYLTLHFGTSPELFLIPAGTRPQERHSRNGRLMAGTGGINPERPIGKPHAVVQRVLARCGYATEKEGEHTLRRSGARAYFDYLAADGYDGALRRVQSMLGHRNTETTEIYLGLDLDRVQRNQDLSGKPMFPSDFGAGIRQLRSVNGEA